MKTKYLLGIALTVSAFFISKICYMKGGENMDIVYATLIINGYRTFAQVPRILKERTKKALEALGMGELAVEEA
ncbi:MAG: CD1375 family protein [Peptoniphilus sp.]|nr:CD1375 family protein [Peptoniphilus sp.]MDY6045242.1 CD1375 family protein [Peptoniphilus sp.]